MGDGLLSLCWNNHRSTFCQVISTLRQKERYSDVTIACEGRFYPVHKLVLSVCSEYFDAMLERTPCKHPIIVLRDVQPEDLEALLSYMYEGIVSVAQNDLARLIKTAEMLRIKGLAVADEPLMTTDGRRVASVTTTGVPIIGSVVHTRPSRESRASPQPKRRRRDENGSGGVSVAQTFTTHVGSPANSADMSNGQDHFEGRQRQRLEIHRDHLVKDGSQTEVVVAEALVKEDTTIDEEHVGKGTATATLISTYGVVVSDGGTHHTIVSHPQDPNQVITHRYEPAQLQAAHQAHSQPLAEAVAEALAGPSGMQTWLGAGELGATSYTTVEAYTAEDDVQAQTLQSQAMESGQTTTVNVTNASAVVNAVSGAGTTVVVEAAPAPPTSCSGTTTSGREGNQLKCHYCNRATFRQTSDLKRHIRIHTGEKPFKCSFCPYKASRKDLLQAHSSKMHSSQERGGEEVIAKYSSGTMQLKNEGR